MVSGGQLDQRLHTSTYPAYCATMKQVWVNAATCAVTRSTTSDAMFPTPVPRSAGLVDKRVAVNVEDHATARRGDYTGSTLPTPPRNDRRPAILQLAGS
jgi:hypothetical protein